MATPFRHRDFALLWSAGLISITGDWMLVVAVPVAVLGITGSSAATAAAFAAVLLPRVFAAPIAGVLVDRWDRRHAMVGAGLLQALLVLPLTTVDRKGDLWIVIATTFAMGCVAQVISTAENALLPTLVDNGERGRANSLNVLNNNLARLIGPALGGVLTASLGLKSVAALDAATFLAAAGLVFLVRTRENPDLPTAHFWVDLRTGLAEVRANRTLRVMFVFLAIVSFGEGVMGTMLVVFVGRALDGGPRDLGWIVSAQAVGGIAGGLLGGVIGDRVPPRLLIGMGSVALGLGDLVIFNYPHWYPRVWPALVLMGLVGVPSALANAGMMTVLQTSVDDRLRGRVFGAGLTVMALLALCGTATCAALGDRFGPVALLNIQGIGMTVGGVFVLFALRTVTAVSGVTPATQRTSATAGRTA